MTSQKELVQQVKSKNRLSNIMIFSKLFLTFCRKF